MRAMSKKSAEISRLIAARQGQGYDPHYLGFFDCFNCGRYFEAHDVLEELWLAEGKSGPNYRFYKGLIQLAGAFVHLQKERLRPAVALYKLAAANLREYPSPHEGLEVARVLHLVSDWQALIETGSFAENPLPRRPPPQLPVPQPPTS